VRTVLLLLLGTMLCSVITAQENSIAMDTMFEQKSTQTIPENANEQQPTRYTVWDYLRGETPQNGSLTMSPTAFRITMGIFIASIIAWLILRKKL